MRPPWNGHPLVQDAFSNARPLPLLQLLDHASFNGEVTALTVDYVGKYLEVEIPSLEPPCASLARGGAGLAMEQRQ